jgi:TP901 family phage tail tape measure protein
MKIKEVGESIKNVGDRITSIGRTLTTSVTVPIVSAFGASAKAAVDWESAFIGVQKTVDATDAEFEQLATNIKKMATETISSANDIAGVMEIAGQLGIDGVDNLTQFTRTMVELGDTTNLSAEEAATALARFMNITGDATENIDKIGAAVVDLGNNFPTTEAEIVAMATRLASAGTIAGMTSTDILALATAMSSVGIQAEAGGTAMTQTISAMTSAVADFEAGSTEDLEKIASVANMSAADFAKAWNEQPIEAVQNFIAGLGTLDQKGENATLVLDELGMSGVRQANMLKSLSLASGILADAIDTSSEAYKKNTALSEEAAKRYGSNAAKIHQLKESITQLGVEIGEMLMPYLQKAIEYVEGLVEKWKALDDQHKEAILKFAAIAAAIGPVLVIIGTLVSSVGSIVSAFGSVVSGAGKLVTLITNVAGATEGLSGVLAALSGPVGIVVAAVAALAGGFLYLYNTNESFRASIQQTVETLKTNFQNMLTTIKPALEALGQAFQALMDLLAPIFEALFTMVVAYVNGVIAALEPIIGVVTNIVEFITNILQALIAYVQGDTDAAFQYLLAALQNWINGMQNFIRIFVTFVTGFFKTFGIDLKTIFTTMWNNVKEAVTTAINNIQTFITETWTTIKTWLGTTLDEMKDKLKDTFEKMKEAVEEKIGKIKETIINGIEEAVNYIKELPQKFYSWGADMVQKLIDGIQSKINALRAKISELASTIRGYIHFSEPDVGPLSDFHTYMPDMINEMVRGINNGIPRISGAMNNLASNMLPQMNMGAASSVANNSISINVYGAQGQNVNELAEIIEERLAENMMRRGAAFG